MSDVASARMVSLPRCLEDTGAVRRCIAQSVKESFDKQRRDKQTSKTHSAIRKWRGIRPYWNNQEFCGMLRMSWETSCSAATDSGSWQTTLRVGWTVYTEVVSDGRPGGWEVCSYFVNGQSRFQCRQSSLGPERYRMIPSYSQRRE